MRKTLLVMGALLCLSFNGFAWAEDLAKETTPVTQPPIELPQEAVKETDKEAPKETAKDTKAAKDLDQAQQAFDTGKYTKAIRLWQKMVTALKDAAAEDMQQINQLAGCLKHLADCYRIKERWIEAGEAYRNSLAAYAKIADKPEAIVGLAEIAQQYRTVSLDQMGEKAAKLLKDAGTTCLATFKRDDGDHIEVCLAEPYTQAVNDGRIEQVRFNKRICFDLSKTADGHFTVNRIKGIDIKAEVWVQPRSSSMCLNEKGETDAEVTVNAMGFEKTVNVSPPRKVYDYLAEMAKQVDFSPENSIAPTPTVATDKTASDVQPVAETAIGDTSAAQATTQTTQSPASAVDTGKESDSVSK